LLGANTKDAMDCGRDDIRQYEIGRVVPPPAVRAYLSVIAVEPRITAEVYRKSRAA
jgi:putative transcriptional regulator